MFKSFHPHHEALVERSFGSPGPRDPHAWAALAQVFDVCRAQVIEGLKSEPEPELRTQLRLLYEGLTDVADFLALEKHQPGVRLISPGGG